MLPSLCLISCLMGVTQVQERAEWQLGPRLAVGQELVYQGTIRQTSLGQGVQFSKNYQLEVRLLLLESKLDQAEVACLTRISQQGTVADRPDAAETSSVRLEVLTVDGAGRVSNPKGSLPALSVNGPTTCEFGMFVETPRGKLKPSDTWVVSSPGQTTRRYRLEGTESVQGALCVKITGEQQSDDWEQPRGDRSAWRRKDTVWINTRLGVAARVERELEFREPARREATSRLTARYDLTSNLPFSGMFLEDRKREVYAVRQFNEQVQALIAEHKPAPAAYEALVARIDRQMERGSATPYREALVKLRGLALAASKGNLPPSLITDAAQETFAVGKLAPDFLVEDVHDRGSFTLRRWQGKVILMVFFHPSSASAPEVLRFGQQLAEQVRESDLAVLGLCMADDAEGVRRLKNQFNLTCPMLAGKPLRNSYGVEATPRVVLVDRDGVVRGVYTGWGPEQPAAIQDALRKCLDAADPEEKAK